MDRPNQNDGGKPEQAAGARPEPATGALPGGGATGQPSGPTVRAPLPPVAGPLAGLRAWIITDAKQGMDVQCRGVADALGLDYEMKAVAPTGFHRFASPRIGVARKEGFGIAGRQFAPPWPAFALATGRLSIPYIRALGRLAGADCYCVVLQDPKTPPDTGDFIWVPRHDQRRGDNVFTTLTAPHSFSQQRLKILREQLPAKLKALPGPRVAIVLGGENSIYRYNADVDDSFRRALKSLGELGASFMITTSRRTHPGLLTAALEGSFGRPRVVHEGEGANPYPQFLAAADFLVVTADSVNMTGEAAATGKPVFVFHPLGGSAKFTRFHDALRHYGATRVLPPVVNQIPEWSYHALDSGAEIAAEIERRWLLLRSRMPGLDRNAS